MHGNAKENPNAHHLYRIFKLAGRETFKYGISDDPVDPEDSLSASFTVYSTSSPSQITLLAAFTMSNTP